MTKARRAKPKPKQEKHKKKKLSEFLHKKAEGRQNRYVFKGFYERLTAIRGAIILGKTHQQEVPQHFMPYDSEEEHVELNSNFLASLYNAPKNNASLEFQALHKSLQQYSSSYNFVLMKKDEIIDKLMESMEVNDGVVKDKNLAISAIDLLIALIKDLRKEISFETLFIDKIFPKIISMLNVLELELLEQIISFFSHCFRYMMPTILKNFHKFYKIYFQVLIHKNKFIKKFAAESFTYVLRKVKKENLIKMVNAVCLNPLRKPYKYVKPEESTEEDPNASEEAKENLEDHQGIIYSGISELEDPAFCKVEKWIQQEIQNYKFTREIDGEVINYDYSYQEKVSLLTTVSTIFSEAAYGVQFKLYTTWKSFIDILCDNIKTYKKDQAVWNLNLFRYTMVSLMSRLNSDSVCELTKYVLSKLGQIFYKKIDQKYIIKLDACLLFIRDLLIFKEGDKVSQSCAVSIIGFLYKILKSQIKSEEKYPEKTLFLLTECIFCGYYNKKAQYERIFSLDTSQKLFELIAKLGDAYFLHFYCMGSINDLTQKYYQISEYHRILMNKQPRV